MLILATSILMIDSSKKEKKKVILKQIQYIYYFIRFFKDQEII